MNERQRRVLEAIRRADPDKDGDLMNQMRAIDPDLAREVERFRAAEVMDEIRTEAKS